MATAVYYHPRFLEHDTGWHPESAERLIVARKVLRSSGLDLEWREPSPAPEEAIQRVHRPEYIEKVRALAERGGGRLDLDTAVSPRSFEAALLAVGAGLDAVKTAVGVGDRAFCLVRPPGHHARPAGGMGFCLFNNLAVAATFALEELGLERILVVDWDVHHGNGTQEIFYADPRVLFVNLHQQWHFPGTGRPDEVGEGPGAGFTVNLALPPGAGDGAVRLFFEELIEPLGNAFGPQLVLVSAGYDSQAGDRLGGLEFSRAAFAWMSARLARLVSLGGASGPVFFLEGGYVPESMAQSIVATLKALDEDSDSLGFAPEPSSRETEALGATLRAVGPYWPGVLTQA